MIFRSRRKRRITQQSTDLWTVSKRRGRQRLIAILGLSLLAGTATVDTFGTASAAEPDGRQSFLSKTLQKFKGRSAEKRYEQYKAERLDIEAYVDFCTAPWRERSCERRSRYST